MTKHCHQGRTGIYLTLLNRYDQPVRELSRKSLFLHHCTSKCAKYSLCPIMFLRFKLKRNGKLDIKAAGFEVRSEWLDVNDHRSHRIALQLSWVRPEGAAVALNDKLKTDSLISTLVTIRLDKTLQQLRIKDARASLVRLGRWCNYRQCNRCKRIRAQS